MILTKEDALDSKYIAHLVAEHFQLKIEDMVIAQSDFDLERDATRKQCIEFYKAVLQDVIDEIDEEYKEQVALNKLLFKNENL